MKTLIVATIRLSWLTFKTGWWIPLAALYAAQYAHADTVYLTRLRRFAILKSFQKPQQSIAEMMRNLCFRTRLVFDYLRMTKNSAPSARGSG